MKIEMKILTKTYNDDKFDIVVSELKKQGWDLKRQYGGKMPNYTGHGAELEKVCFSSDKQLQKQKDNDVKQLPIHVVINWVAVSEKLPTRMDEDYLVCVRNKNKEGGIPIQDIGNFSSDGVWIKQNTWEDVVYWAELPKPPCL